VSLFVVFSKLNINSRLINNLAKAAFMCYIVHTQVIGIINWDVYFKGNVFLMTLVIVAFCFSMYLISWLIYKAYTVVSQPLFKKLNAKEIVYFERVDHPTIHN